MTALTYVTRDGSPWQPMFLEAIDGARCIGCGRCFKVCGLGVLETLAINEDGEEVDPDGDEVERLVMRVANKGMCIGCGACSRVCAKNAQKHVAAA